MGLQGEVGEILETPFPASDLKHLNQNLIIKFELIQRGFDKLVVRQSFANFVVIPLSFKPVGSQFVEHNGGIYAKSVLGDFVAFYTYISVGFMWHQLKHSTRVD